MSPQWHLGRSLALVVLGLALAVPAVWGQGGTVSSSYMQTFDGMPSAPTAYRPPGWDVQVHSRDPQTWDTLEPMVADHGPACEGPPAQHALMGDYPASVFQCHDHVMTSIKADGYGVIYLTPPALLDWRQSEATLRWDMSTQRGSIRDWVDVWLTPYADHLNLPLEGDFVPDLAGSPPNYIHLQMGAFNGESTWTLTAARDGVTTYYGPPWGFTWPSVEAVVQPSGGPSASRRDTFELKVRDGHIQLGMPGFSTVWIDSDTAPFGFEQAVVQFGHHSYFPAKGCEGLPDGGTCPPNTWHWDNVLLSPAVPISITALEPRQFTNTTGAGGWVFPTPALPDTTLQFSADSAPADVPGVELSWDGGATWQAVGPAPSSRPGAPNHAHSYRVPVPVGAPGVEVRGVGGTGVADWRVKDAALWLPYAPGQPAPPTPAPAATATAQASITPLVPTATATDRPTAIPATATPGATRTAVPTVTPPAMPSPTPVAGTLPAPDPSRPCQVPVARFGVLTWRDAPASSCR